MKETVIAIFDIGKTNKKLLLFNGDLKVVSEVEHRFPEIKDDDGFECDDIELIESWIRDSVMRLSTSDKYDLKAVNFTTYGATVVNLDSEGRRLTPVYNYLKPMEERISENLYKKYGGRDEFCRRTASPALGMLNSGLQPLWLKTAKPEVFAKIRHILHLPQYLSYTLTGKIYSEHTSIGCHTAMWDFDNMQYHPWIKANGLELPNPVPVSTVTEIEIEGNKILAGIGIHDSSASLAVNHPDLAGTWRGGTNSWFDPYGVHSTPFDYDGHGTSVLGIMVGGGAGGTTIGTAPESKWIAAKMFDDAGNTFDSVIHQVFQWFLDPDGNPTTDDAPDVVNASWGFQNLPGICENTFQPDIDALTAAGIAVVFAAGNTGPGVSTSISPANNAGAIAVGSVDDLNVIDPTSARGPSTCDGRIYPDVVAPGDTIKTADLSFGGFPYYVRGTGTSFSAPHASGVLTLLRSAFPNATLAQLKLALTGSATDLGAVGPDNTYGNGLVNAAAAYASLGASCIRPQVDFTAAPFPASANQLITFTSTVSGGSQPYSYAWDFNGDGVTDCVDAVCSHSYASAYNGSVVLTVTDANGCASSLVIADGWAACTPISPTFTFSPAMDIVCRSWS